MADGLEIDPAAIETVRTSVRRILEQADKGPPSRPFRNAEDFPLYWQEAETLYGASDLTLRIASELPVGGFGRTSYAFASANTWKEALDVFCRESQRGMSGYRAELQIDHRRQPVDHVWAASQEHHQDDLVTRRCPVTRESNLVVAVARIAPA